MARTGDGADQSLVELRSVDDAYPLYGALVTEPALPHGALFDLNDGSYGAVAAQILGGLLVGLLSPQWGWRAAFLVSVPLCLLAFQLASGARSQQAVARGFRAMQYNLVVSTNEVAVRLWQRHGFEIVGTLPGAFRHPRLGEVDAHVMYKRLRG